jgi:membrane protease YdiL (CAAX protease family)
VEFFAAAAAAASEPLDWTDFAWIAFTIAIFAYVIRRVFQPGGDAVDVSHYGRVETAIAVTLTCWFVLQGITFFNYAAPAEKATQFTLRDLALNAAMMVVFTTVVILILNNRGGNLNLLFGFGRQPIWKATILALVLILAAFPIVLAGMTMTQSLAKGPDDLQEIVKFFRGAGRERERWAVVLTAVVIAPFSEELFFRGLIYGVAKKYGGVAAAMIFNAALFAFIHGSLPALGGLFALAVCLTLAYELSGSLYVPIVMHACFNATELTQMFLEPAAPKP